MDDETSNIFSAIQPGKYHEFSLPNPALGSNWLDTEVLVVSFLDSAFKPVSGGSVPAVGPLVVPKGREQDPLFVIANKSVKDPQSVYTYHDVSAEDIRLVEDALNDILLPLHPEIAEWSGTKFLTYKDGLIFRIPRGHGSNYVIVDEEEKLHNKKQLWRRIRFENSPGRFHLQARLVLKDLSRDTYGVDVDKPMLSRDDLFFEVDDADLGDNVANAMLVGLNSVPSLKRGNRCLCFGATLGIFVRFVANIFDFQVVFVDDDAALMESVKSLYKIPDSVAIEAPIAPMDIIEEVFAPRAIKGKRIGQLLSKGLVETPFHFLVIDLKSFEYGTRTGLCMPPREMIDQEVLIKMKALLYDNGAILIHVIAPDFVFYADLVKNLVSQFHHVYKIDMGNQEHVFVATMGSPDDVNDEDNDLKKNLISMELPFTFERIQRP